MMKSTNMLKDDLYASHLPILAKVVEKTTGPILEYGMGFSTTLFHTMCKQSKRLVVSYENDRKWYERFKEYNCDWHHIKYVEDWDSIPTEYIDWGLVFLDHRPARRRRIDALKYKDKADYILLHDSEPEQDKFFGYKKIYPEFKHRYQYLDCKPNTTVLSNFKSVIWL